MKQLTIFDNTPESSDAGDETQPLEITSGSSAEQLFLALWIRFAPDDAPQFKREYRGIPGRKYRFDFALPTYKIAVEIDGGIWSGGRHVRGKGFEEDLEKMNLAVLYNWKVLRFTPGMLERGGHSCIAQIMTLVKRVEVAVAFQNRSDTGERLL